MNFCLEHIRFYLKYISVHLKYKVNIPGNNLYSDVCDMEGR